MNDPLSFAALADLCTSPQVVSVFAARVNRSSGWAVCVVVGEALYHNAPTMTEGDARGTVDALRKVKR